jgi:hypothetical protein
VATPPTRVSYNTPSSGNYTSSTSPKTTAAFDVQSGDLIVVAASAANAAAPLSGATPSASGGSVTWTLRASQTAGTANQSWASVWTGAVGATATGITVSLAQPTGDSSIFYGLSATVWRDHGGVGTTFSGNNGTSAGTPSQAGAANCAANSAVQCVINDWNAIDGTNPTPGRTWLTINGAAESESLYARDSAQHTAYGGYRTDTGSAGAVTQGLSAPTGQRWVLVGVEILGTAGTAATLVGRRSKLHHPGRRGPTNLTRFYKRRGSTEIPAAGGTTFPAPLDGSVTATGVLSKQVQKPLTGSSTPTGVLTRQTQKPLGGASTPTGILTRQTQKTLTGSSTPTGVLALTKVILRAFAGSSTPTGVLTKQVQKLLTRSSTPTGILTRQTQKTLTGSSTPTGVLSTIKAIIRSFAGSSTPTGTLTNQVRKPLAGAVTPTGLLTKQIQKTLTGSSTPTGVLSIIKAIIRAFAGASTPTGTLTRQTQKPLTGSVTPTGVLTKQARKTFTASSTPTGVLTAIKVVLRTFTGSSTPTGLLTKQVKKPLAGAVTAVGLLTKQVRKLLTGRSTPTGTLATSSFGADVGTPVPTPVLTLTTTGSVLTLDQPTGTVTLTFIASESVLTLTGAHP